MTTYNAADFGKKLIRTPEGGNGFNESYRYVFTAIAAASLIYFGIIPAGVQINGVKATFDANTASLTLKLGYTPVDAANGPSVSDAYWWAATAITTAGVITSAAHPVTFDFPVIIVGTTAAATATADAVINVTVNGKIVGIK